ncbi:MAG: hypothetical protein ACKVU2_06560 [Saprospiraceae bacterium]
MTNAVLFDLVSTFDRAELLRFGKFVRSPFFTHRTDVARLFACLAKSRYRGKAFPDKNALFLETFPGREYDDLALRAAMSDLRELLEDFLVWQYFQSDALRISMALMAQFRERNLPKMFEKQQRQTQKRLDEASIRNAEFHQKSLEFLFETAQFKARTTRTSDLPLQDISDALDLHYLAQKLRHACTQLSHQAVYRTQYDLGLLPVLIEQVEHSGFIRVPAIALYYFCYRFLTEQYSLSWFQKFRDELFENERLFPATELKSLYLLATNFCIRQLNEGNSPFVAEGWRLYQEGLSRGFLIEHGRMSSFTFNNIVAFGIRLEVFDAVEQFIGQYQGCLEPVQQKSFVDFNLARLEYRRNNLALAMQYLQTADFKDLVNNLIAKTLLLKIYYQLGEFEILDAHLDSFRQFISRRELSEYHRKNYSNIVAIVKKMISLQPGDRKGRAALREKIRTTEVLTEREWLSGNI